MTQYTALSCYILTSNSERRLDQVLESIKSVADEVLIVDSGSTDRTLAIAESYGARTLYRPFDNFRDQRVYAEDNCSHIWVLALDSDEVLSESLQAKISEQKVNGFVTNGIDDVNGFSLRRDWYFMGKKVRNFYPVKTPEYIVRLFRRDKISHRGSQLVHEQLQVDDYSKIAVLDEPILHYSCDSVEDLYKKIELYTNLCALEMHQNKIRSSWIKRYLYPWMIWFRWQIIYKGILDGREGRIIGGYIRNTVRIKYDKLKYLGNQSTCKI